MKLTSEQIAFFKDNGYLVLEGVLDKELCAQARDRMWTSLPENCQLKRDDPNTYTGPFKEPDILDDSMHTRLGYRWQLREVSTEPLFINLMYNPELCGIAEQLLGEGTLRAPTVGGQAMGSEGPAWPGGPVDPAINEGVRGFYCTLPYGDKPQEPDYGHTDGHPFNLGVVGVVHDVPPGGGAFKVWPKSHRRLYPTFQMQYDQPRIPFYKRMPSYKGIIHSTAYIDEFERIMKDTTPVDCWAKEGDAVLWHHRLAHMAGHNYTDVIRQAVLYDFCRTDLDTCRMDPPQENMWRDWSDELGKNNDTYSAEFARSQRLTD